MALNFNSLSRKALRVPPAVALFLCIAALFFVYLWQANGVATSIYRLNLIEQEKQEVLSRLQRLDLQRTEFQSASVLSSAAADLGLEQPNEVHYLSPASLDVAVVLPE